MKAGRDTPSCGPQPSLRHARDKYHLEGLWRDWIATKVGMPKDPDKAFIGWCRKFTKGKRPT